MSARANSHPLLDTLIARRKLALEVFFLVIVILGAGALLNLRYSASAVLALDPQSIVDAQSLDPDSRPKSAVEVAWSALPDKQIAAIIQQFRLNTGLTRLRAQDGVFAYVRSNISLRRIGSAGGAVPEIMLSYTGAGPSTVLGVTNALAQSLVHPTPPPTAVAPPSHPTAGAASIAQEIAKTRSDLQILSQSQSVKIPPDALQQHEKTDTELRAARQESEVQLGALEQEDRQTERAILNAPKARVQPHQTPTHQTPTRNPAAIALEQQIREAQARLAVLRQRYTDEYPDVVEARQTIAILQNKLLSLPAETPQPAVVAKVGPAPAPSTGRTSEELRISQQEAEVREHQRLLDQAIQANEAETAALQQRIADAATVAHDYAAEQQRYKMLLEAQQAAGGAPTQDDSGIAPRFIIVKSATNATALGIAAKPLFWILGGAAALLCACFAVFVAEQFGSPVDDEAPSRSLHMN